MPLNLPLTPVLLLSSGIILVIIANVVFYSVLRDVNRRRNPQDAISMLFVNLRFFEVMRSHGQLFPASNKRRATYLLFVVGVALIFSIFLFGTHPW